MREQDFQRPGEAPEARIISQLESGCTTLREALNHAQHSLKRRKICLTKWQSDLVELDTLMAEIKSLLRSTSIFPAEARTDNPSIWLSRLHQQLQDPPKDNAAVQSRVGDSSVISMSNRLTLHQHCHSNTGLRRPPYQDLNDL